MTFEYFSKNGAVLPTEQAVVSLGSVEYSYGFGVYETIRVNSSRPLYLQDHLSRLKESARIINLEHEFKDKFIEEALLDLLLKNNVQTCNVKILLIGAEHKEDASLYIFCSSPLFPDRKMYRDGVSVITYEYERAFPHAKTLNMLQSYLAYREAKRAASYEALLIDRQGFVREGTRTNIFCLNNKTIISPPEESILLGVTRSHMIKVALEQGFEIIHKNITIQDLKDADSSFLTSTSTKIMPIKSIDRVLTSANYEQLKVLMYAFNEFQKSIID